MKAILTTTEFEEWFSAQSDKTKGIIRGRLYNVSIDHWGDHKRFDGLIELRWKNGNRIYVFEFAHMIVVVLCGGNKNGQGKDIKKAKKIRDEISQGLRSPFRP